MQGDQAIQALRAMLRAFLRRKVEYSTLERLYVDYFADANADEFFDDRDPNYTACSSNGCNGPPRIRRAPSGRVAITRRRIRPIGFGSGLLS
jgi:hypothetical protein